MADHDSHLSCSVCFQPFTSSQRRPWDIGCGHSFCEQCLRQHPRSFRYCPECRARASNPHVNIALLRLVDATQGSPQQQQQQGTETTVMRSNTAPQPIAQPSAAEDTTTTSSNSMSRVLQAIQEATAANTARQWPTGAPAGPLSQPHRLRSSSSTALQTIRPGDLHGSLDQHRAKIAEWRTSMWLYLTPIMGMLYVLSPLDLIPDIIPLVGLLDDFLVIVYIVFSVYSILRQQSDRIQL